MKTLEIKIIEKYKSYMPDTCYSIQGDLVILSGINGSGKSQLLKIIANNGNEKINRSINQILEDGNSIQLENVLLYSFRDNIDLGNELGQFSVTFRNSNIENAWNFYIQNLKHSKGEDWQNNKKTQRYKDKSLIYNNNGTKNSSWRSINKLIQCIESNYTDQKMFNLSRQELESVLPNDFIWRNENDIIQLVGNLFYMACCERVNKQIEYSSTSAIFDNKQWLTNAPLTILNKLFEDLKFKYRFKNDYEFKTPNMEENPKLRVNNEIRSLMDLSDGEKAILKLALISLDEEISRDVKIVLFDEYDAPLNPSLTEAFYHVVNEFYIKKGIQVVVATHSPATISLAPDFAQFYEVFPIANDSPKIVHVNQFDYEELRKANKGFYDKLKNQEERIQELEQYENSLGKMLFVEDQYDQIYKIAYLKIKGIKDITVENLNEKFAANSDFTIHGNFSSGGLYNRLICSNVTSDQDSSIICLFDFDTEGYRKFEDLSKKKINDNKIFSNKAGTITTGLILKHNQIDRYALMLPIPERLTQYVSTKTSSDCFIEVETLISEEYLKTNPKAELRSSILTFYKMKDKHKKDFWIDLLSIDEKYFDDFKPLFSQIDEIFNRAKKENTL